MKCITGCKIGLVGLLVSMFSIAQAVDIVSGNTTVSLKGFIRVNMLSASFDKASKSSANDADDLSAAHYFPAKVIKCNLPTIKECTPRTFVDLTSRQTRFAINTSTKLDDGTTVGSVIEFDFLNTNVTGSNSVVSNSFVPRMRLAYATIADANGTWTFGQDWTTFQTTDTYPETVEFLGTTDGVIFNRQPLIRYTTSGGFSIGLEKPATTLEAGKNKLVANASALSLTNPTFIGTSRIPDITLKYVFKNADMSVAVRGLIRELGYEGTVVASGKQISIYEIGYALGFSGKFNFDGGDVRFTVDTGNIGRYGSFGSAKDGVLYATSQNAVDVNSTSKDIKLDLTNSTLYSLAIKWNYDTQVRSTIAFAGQTIDLDNSKKGNLPVGSLPTQIVSSTGWFFNVFYSPIKNFDIGFEFGQNLVSNLKYRTTDFASDKLKPQVKGTVNRFELALKYSF
ncbi:MAG: DcaP family trimeric outer membrane transporter [Methylacidiphilales bacterium]|nr:DcaP family trimeric outer membrane transporter [Candidatus Methylacidiphilales bacterium]